MRPNLKNTHKKRTDGVAQVVEHLASKHEALSSNPNIAKKKKMVSTIRPILGQMQLRWYPDPIHRVDG
jgi:hypothetical protein